MYSSALQGMWNWNLPVVTAVSLTLSVMVCDRDRCRIGLDRLCSL